MRAGDLDRRMIFESFTELKDSTGYAVKTWSTFKTVWAMKTQLDGKERDVDENRSTGRMIKFRINWRSDLNNTMRIKFESQWYKIEDIKELGRKDGLQIITSLLAQT